MGIVAVHPNIASLVPLPARLGQATETAAADVSSEAQPASDAPKATATAAPIEESKDAAVTTAATPTTPVTPNSVAAHVVEPFQPLVTKTHTTSAAVVEAGAYINNEGMKEELAANIRALNLASDRLAAAEAEASKVEQDVQQKEIETQAAELDVRAAAEGAAAGSSAETLEDAAKVETAGLAEDKRSYLLTRGEYEASTKLIVDRKAELETAKENTEQAQKAYASASNLANAAKKEADTMAKAAAEHLAATKNAAVVGEETFQEGVQRSQTMAQITAAATSQEIKAGDLKIAAANAERRVNDVILLQKTAQETLDAEIARNAQLKLASNVEQKTFIDASDVAAKDATAAADAGKKAKDALDAAHVRLATAEDALSKSHEERDRLKNDILATRRAEYDAQFAKTEATRAKANVVDAVSSATVAASKVESVKQSNVRDAKVATVVTKFDDAAKQMAAEKLEQERQRGVEAANLISHEAASIMIPFEVEVPVEVTYAAVEQPTQPVEQPAQPAATTSTPVVEEQKPVEETTPEPTPESANAVAATGERESVAQSQAKTLAQSKAQEEKAIKARMAVIQAQMAARQHKENLA